MTVVKKKLITEACDRVLTQFELSQGKFTKEDLLNLSILGDIFFILSKIPDNTLDVIIADPPYNISQRRIFIRKNMQSLKLSFGNWDYMGYEEYLTFIFTLLHEFHRVLKDSGTLYCFIADIYLSFARRYCENNLNMHIATTYVWVKPNPPPRFDKKHFAFATEFCIVAQKNKDKATFNFQPKKDWHNTSSIPIVSGKERLKSRVLDKRTKKPKTLHPTQKPLELIMRYIEISSNEYDLIGDFMAGTFTTSVSAKRKNRYYIAIEKSSRFFRYGTQRVVETEIDYDYTVFHKQKKITDTF